MRVCKKSNKKKSGLIKNEFSYFPIETYVVGTQKNHPNDG